MHRLLAELAHPFGQRISGREDLVAVVVEHAMVVAEVRPRHVPVEVLGLGIEHEGVGHELVDRIGDRLPAVVAEVARGGEGGRIRVARFGGHGLLL